jgi:hypothetical protein
VHVLVVLRGQFWRVLLDEQQENTHDETDTAHDETDTAHDETDTAHDETDTAHDALDSLRLAMMGPPDESSPGGTGGTSGALSADQRCHRLGPSAEGSRKAAGRLRAADAECLMSAEDFALMAAIQIERDAGLPCGECGLPHAISPDDFDRGHAGLCSCLTTSPPLLPVESLQQLVSVQPERQLMLWRVLEQISFSACLR